MTAAGRAPLCFALGLQFGSESPVRAATCRPSCAAVDGGAEPWPVQLPAPRIGHSCSAHLLAAQKPHRLRPPSAVDAGARRMDATQRIVEFRPSTKCAAAAATSAALLELASSDDEAAPAPAPPRKREREEASNERPLKPDSPS